MTSLPLSSILENRCARETCTIGGTSEITQLVYNAFAKDPVTWQQYYNDSLDLTDTNFDITNANVGAGSPNDACIPSGVKIHLGSTCLKARDAIVTSSLHYEFPQGLRITETESTITIYHPGPITIDQSINTTKDLIIMSVAGASDININANILARNIIITAMAGQIIVAEYVEVIATQGHGSDSTNATVTPDSQIVLFGAIVINHGSLIIRSGRGFINIIARICTTFGNLEGDYLIRSTEGTDKKSISYDGTEFLSNSDSPSPTATLAATISEGSVTIANPENDRANFFIEDDYSYIIIHTGPVVLPDFGEAFISKNLTIITPFDITLGNVRTWRNADDVAGNITLISNSNITATGALDLSPNDGGIGGICTIIAENISTHDILVCNGTISGSGRALIVSALDATVYGVGGNYDSSGASNEGAHDAISISAGRTLCVRDGLYADQKTTDISSTINVLVGADFNLSNGIDLTSNYSNDEDLTNPGGNLFIACGGSFRVHQYSEGSNEMFLSVDNNYNNIAAGGNIFITTGSDFEMCQGTIYIDGLIDGQAVLIVGSTNLPTIAAIDANEFHNFIIYTLVPDYSNNNTNDHRGVWVDWKQLDVTNLERLEILSIQNTELWSSKLELGIESSIDPHCPCVGRLTTLYSDNISNGIWSWLIYPDATAPTLTPFSVEGIASVVKFTPSVDGQYVAQVTGSIEREFAQEGFEDMTQLCYATQNIFFTSHFAVTITQQPRAMTVNFGKPLAISVTATGSATPLSYQWYLNDAAITDATHATYSKSSVTLADYGIYTVIITDNNGCTVKSKEAVIIINPNNI